MADSTQLHILALIKWVPDAQLERQFTDSHLVDRSEGILAELDEYPLEAALALREALAEEGTFSAQAVRVTAVTLGPEGASTAAKKALQIGADDSYRVTDNALAGADVAATSTALAASISTILAESTPENHLILTGMASDDGETGAVAAQLAERLGLALISQATEIRTDGDRLNLVRVVGNIATELSVGYPAVISVTDQANTPRYPNFKAIMAAKKKPSTAWSLENIGLSPQDVGSRALVQSAVARPPREAGEIITDDGDAGERIVDFLAKERVL